MNKKIAWIEATPNDLDTWKQYYSLFVSSFEMAGIRKILLIFLILKIPKIS
jgi:hypothetical protein